MFKFKNKTQPTPFRNYFTPASNFYNYETRNSKKGGYYIYPKSTKTLLKDQFKYVEPNCGTNSQLDYRTELCQLRIKRVLQKIKIALLETFENKYYLLSTGSLLQDIIFCFAISFLFF